MRHALIGLALLGCGGGGPCAEPSGNFLIRYQHRGGGCDATLPERVSSLNPFTAEAENCAIDRAFSDDRCLVEYEVTCATSGYVGTARVTASGTHIDATESVTLYDDAGTELCQGTFDVTFDKL